MSSEVSYALLHERSNDTGQMEYFSVVLNLCIHRIYMHNAEYIFYYAYIEYIAIFIKQIVQSYSVL